ncbi:hypothetical protein LTR95_007373 [Oleoguttula sp. CCFEE 5521]
MLCIVLLEASLSDDVEIDHELHVLVPIRHFTATFDATTGTAMHQGMSGWKPSLYISKVQSSGSICILSGQLCAVEQRINARAFKADTMTSVLQEEQTLLDRLDYCWTLYLALLDNYTAAQRQIQDHCSHGFLALARANARAPPGRRYGQDWYDGRMKASCRVFIEDGETHQNLDTTTRLPKIAIKSHRSSKIDSTSVNAQNGSSGNEECTSSQHLPTPPGTPREEEIPPASSDSPGTGNTSDTTSGDPLRWYGILTAPDLRRAQAAFTELIGERTETATDADYNGLNDSALLPNAISMATTASRGLRELDAEIRRLRKSVIRTRRANAV